MSEFITVLEESELQGDVLRAAEANGVALVLSRYEDGEACAIANACTHGGGSLAEGTRDGSVVICPCQGARFDLCSGEVLKGPARKSQQRFEARGSTTAGSRSVPRD